MRPEQVSFEDELVTGQADGIFTFRGNYHRTLTSYGTAQIEKETFSPDYWTYDTGKLLKSSGTSYWSGNGWTGQPLIVQWDEATKQIMNLYTSKKEKKDLVEVIYATLDGYIYFYDLEDGTNLKLVLTDSQCNADGFSLDDKRTEVKDNDIPDIIARFKNLEAEADRQRTEKSFFVPKDEIVENGYDLSINKYKKTEYVAVEYPSTTEILADLHELEMQITAGLAELEGML